MSIKRDLMTKVDTADDGYVYLASPFTQHAEGTHAGYEEACAAAGYLMDELGIPTFSPIAHSYSIHCEYGEVKSDTHDFWLSMDDPILRHASAVVVLATSGWDISYGISVELERFVNDPSAYIIRPVYPATEYNVYVENRIALIDYIRRRREKLDIRT